MAELEVLQKGNPQFHTSVPIRFKQYVCNRISWVDVSNYVLCDNIQGRCLLSKKKFIINNYFIILVKGKLV